MFSDIQLGLIGIGAVLVLLALRVPIGVALGAVSLVGIAQLRGVGASLSTLKSIPYDFGASFTLSAIPMFLLMGAVAHHAGVSAALFQAARVWFGRLPGGLAIASNFACAGFAAASGSSAATAAAMGRIAIPEMLDRGYDKGLATGVVASAGTLGTMIPPSILFVLYGIFAEVSISRLLIAGIFPGILTAVVYGTMIYTRCAISPRLAPPVDIRASFGEKIRFLAGVTSTPCRTLTGYPLPVSLAHARMVAEPPRAGRCTGVLQPKSLPPSTAPIATGWSDTCRAGFAPARRRRLSTAHRIERASLTYSRDAAFIGYFRARKGRRSAPLGRRDLRFSMSGLVVEWSRAPGARRPVDQGPEVASRPASRRNRAASGNAPSKTRSVVRSVPNARRSQCESTGSGQPLATIGWA